MNYPSIIEAEKSQSYKLFPKSGDCPCLNNALAKFVVEIIKSQVIHTSLSKYRNKIGGQPCLVAETCDPIT